jgi:cell division protein FtsB
MRIITIILAALILLLQYPLWLGKGGWLKVHDLGQQVEEQKLANQKLQERNALMDAEVRDLKQGSEAIEDHARSKMGMIKQGEVFFQYTDKQAAPAVSVTVPSAQSSRD